MALQSSGAISIDNIRTELSQGQANSSLRTLSSLAGKSTPDAMSEFYGYSNVTATAYTIKGGDAGAGYEQPYDACEGYEDVTVYSASTSLAVGVILYYDDALTSPFDGEGKWFFSVEADDPIEIKGNGTILSFLGGC